MGLKHGRRRSGRQTQLDKSHPGQAQGSARKKRLREARGYAALRATLTAKNYAQAPQDKVRCVIVVNGFAHWTDVFKGKTTTLYDTLGKKYFGTTGPVPALDAIRLGADLNKVSFEREVIGELISHGCVLESLEVEFDSSDRKAWGKCTWYKDHPSYHEHHKGDEKKLSPWAQSLLRSVFKTQYAGDQPASILSSQMAAMALLKQDPRILLHKTLIFRKVVLSPPQPKQDAAPMKKAA